MTEQINTALAPRNIETVTAEIVAIRGYAQRIVLESAIEIGRRLVEAKGMLAHGEWGPWLKEKVEFSQVTATRYMRVFEEYASKQQSLFGAEANCSTLKNLSVSNALMLLAVPEEEREEFALEHDVTNMSARKMEELMKQLEKEKDGRLSAIRERDQALEEAGDLKEELAEAKRRAEEAENRPIEVAVEKADPAETQKAVDAALAEAQTQWKKEKATMEAKLSATEKKWNEQRQRAEKAEREAKEAKDLRHQAEKNRAQVVDLEHKRLEQEVAGLKKQLAMSDGAVASFKTLFEQGQDIFNRMLGSIEKVQEPETRRKLSAAVKSLVGSVGEKVDALG